jgi:glycosyltransferase involved in cell wall biosynthesis
MPGVQMYLLVDAQPLQAVDLRQRGIGRYVRELIRALATGYPGLRVEAVVNAALPPADVDALGPGIVMQRFEPPLPGGQQNTEINERYFGDWLSARRPDAVLVTNFFVGDVLVPRFTPPRPLFVGVVYDLIPLLFHEHYLADAAARSTYAARLRQFAAADLVLAISESTRSDVLRLLQWPDSRVVTILGGADHKDAISALPDPVFDQAVAELQLDQPFILYVGGVDRRKNLSGALEAFAALPAEIRDAHLLVIVCALTVDQAVELGREAARHEVYRRLRLTSYVHDRVLRELYRRCRLMLFPSHYEGLGLPILEALLAGAPIVAANRSSIPEFAGPASLLVDPSSPSAMAAAIRQMLAEPREVRGEAGKPFAAAFKWSDTVRRAGTAIEKAVQARHAHKPARARIAWVSPLPPTRSGISDYSAELLSRLPRDLEIELVVSDQATTASTLARRYPVLRPAEAMEKHQRVPFDLFVYHIGNSDLHAYVLDLMRVQSGLLVLHDVQLGGLALRAREVGAWPGDLAADLEAEGARELAEQLRRGEGDHERIAAEASLSRNLVAASEATIVHSGWSWNQVQPYSQSPVFRIPMGVPYVADEKPSAVRVRLELPQETFVVATLGEVTPAKRVDRLMQACAALPDPVRRDLLLCVVGQTSPASAAELSRLAREAGIGERVRFTGRVPMELLTAYGRAADVCVQLRYPTRGETSAALLRAFAAGSACIISDAGSFTEVPDDVALRVPAAHGQVEALRAALVRLHDDIGLRWTLRERARRFVRTAHDLDRSAQAYAAAIGITIARRVRRDGDWVDGVAEALATAGQTAALEEGLRARWTSIRRAVLGESVSGAR